MLCAESIRAIQQYFALLPFARGFTLTSQDYNPSSVVYVPEPIIAIQGYLAWIETQSVVMTSFKWPLNLKLGVQEWSCKNRSHRRTHRQTISGNYYIDFLTFIFQCPYEWFHYPCVGITAPPKGKWFCPKCQANMARRKNRK